MIHKYVCSYCGQDDFKTEQECFEHESLHKLTEKLTKIPGSIICPDCSGKGWKYETNSSTAKTCKTCEGEGIILKKNVS